MAPNERLLNALERQRQILNELARICALIAEELKSDNFYTKN